MSEPIIGRAASYGEPWRIGIEQRPYNESRKSIYRADRVSVASTGGTHSNLPEHENLPQELDAAAKRIVACVNACAGLGLPDNVQVGALAELVKACRDYMNDTEDEVGIRLGKVRNLERRIEAALAKLDGTNA